ncbi:MAG: cadherin domain-containing protein [Verrucomicrobiota bacterium]
MPLLCLAVLVVPPALALPPTIRTTSDAPQLSTVLSRVDSSAATLTALVPGLYPFVDGVTGSSIGDGGDDMFDTGNILNTSAGPAIPYSDGVLSTHAGVGAGGSYFTRKRPGLFTFAADLDGATSFSITGELGADGDGSQTTAELTRTVGGVTFKGFVKRVYGAGGGDPSVNHLIITADRPGLAQSIGATTNNDLHTVTGLSGQTRLYYLLFATNNGGFVSDTVFGNVMDTFLADVAGSSAIVRASGASAAPAAIATVSDAETAAGSLTVTATTVPAGINVTSIVNTAGAITAVITADAGTAPGSYTVILTVSDGALSTTGSLAVTVIAGAPTVAAVSPGFGSTAGGAQATVVGTNFTGTPAVTFGGTAATAVTVLSATTLTCLTPAHSAGAVDVSVTTSGGTSSRTNGYTYYIGSAGVAFSNFMDATTVVGQTSFTTVSPTASQTITPGPGQVATSVTGKFAIADSYGSRVLIWNSVPTSNGVPADVVVGQPNFTSTTGVASASLMGAVNGVAFSRDGQKLIAVDGTNNRLLIWNTVPTSNGAAADVVIGQANFTSNSSGATASKFSAPQGLLVTPDGKLLVGDRVNNRVMVYNAIPTTNNAAADVVIGQPNKTSVTSGTGAAQMDRPWAQALAPDGRLLIADEFNHRVLVFASVPTSDGASASVVIGQPGFGSNATATTQTGMFQPVGVAVSPEGKLAVSDYNNHRVLIYNSVPTANGAAADFVLGQPNFTSSTPFNGGTSAHSISGPSAGMFTPDSRLVVPGWGMRRAMIYGTAPFAPALTSIAPVSGTTAGGTSVVITGTNFTGASSVTIGGTAVTSYTVDSNTQITATTAAHAAGASSVVVTTPAGANAANTLFTYIIPNVAPTDITLSLTSIDENNAINATVGTLTATDADAGQTHTFTLVAGNGTNDVDNGSFTISGSSLRLTPVADFETKASYALRVRATDNGAGNLSYDKSLVVTITNVNEAPTLTVTNAAVSANEGSTITNSGTFADVDSSTITLSASVGSVSATAPAVLRSDLTTGAAWRRPAVNKPLDADGNHVYGTDGYAMWGLGGTITNVAPAYATVTKLAAGYYGGNGSYTSIDNPADPDGAKVVTGINYANPGVGASQNFVRVTFTQAKTVRIGVLVDNADRLTLSPATLRLRQTTGGSYDTGHLAAATAATRNKSSDWYFFDVVAKAGDIFELSGNSHATDSETGIGGVVFDSHPGALPFSGSGAWAWTYSPSDGPLNSTVTITANDGALDGTTSFSLNVANVVPTGTFAASPTTTIENTSTPPAVSFTSPVDPSSADTSAGLRYSFDFNNDGNWEIGDGTYAGGTTSSSQTVPATLFIHPAPPTRTVKGRIIDKDAGFTDYTAVITINRAVPAITSVSPGFGGIAGGADVTITGTNLTGASAVNFDGIPATNVTVVNATSITAKTPAHAVGYVDVSVTTGGGTATLTNGYIYYTGSGGITGNFPDASLVIGQPNFTTATASNTQSTMQYLCSGTVSSTGKMAAVDLSAGRVLIWNSIPTSNGAPANVVVGKPDFTSTTQGTTQSLTRVCRDVTFTPDGQKLIVSDQSNNRVLIWNTIPTTNGTPASVVLGQPDFVTSTAGVTASKMNGPVGLLVTPDGKLLVADGSNNRVLVWNSVPTVNSTPADVVIGQANKTSNSAGTGAHQMSISRGLARAPDGRLVVGDQGNSRLLVFPSVPTTDGASASVVIGQSAFGVTGGGLSQTKFGGTNGVSVSSSGQLAAADYSYNRVMIWNSIPTTNGAAADYVLGQPNFTTSTASNGGVSARSLNQPYEVEYAPDGRLFVGSAYEHRLLVFGTSYLPTIASVSPNVGPIAGGTSVIITGTNFTGASSVNFGGTEVTSFTVDSNTQITATTAGHAAGAVSVLVTTPAGTNAANTLFNYNLAPTDIALSSSSIAENNTAGATVGTLTATDADVGQTHTFTLVTGAGSTDNGSFTITGGTSLKLTPVANFEVKPNYLLRVEANDGAGGTYQKALTVTITNVNETPSLETSQLVYETVTPKRNVGGDIVYSVNNAAALAGASFNRARYRMETRVDGVLRYADAAFDAWAGLTPAGLAVPTINNPLVIQRNVSNMTVDSNFTGRSNATAVTTGHGFTGRLEVWPYDYDEPAVASPSVGGSSILFDFDDTNRGSAQYGSFQVHNVSAVAKHTVFSWSNHANSITAQDVGFGSQIGTGTNKHPDWTFSAGTSLGTTNWKLQIFLGSQQMLSLAENAAAGTTAGSLSAVDPDTGDTATFTLVSGAGDADNGSFTLSGSQLLSSAPFDFETKPALNIRVRLTDTAGLFTESALVVNVTDVNEAPTDITLSPTNIAENNTAGATVGTLAATDADAGQAHTYTLVTGAGSTDNGSFTITGTSLKLTPMANFEVKPTYALRVRATDNGTGNLFYEKALTVTITDVNEAPTLATSQLVYETVTPRRSGNNIVYSVNNSAALAGATFSRVRYRMETRVDTVLRYADVSFDAWSGLTTAGLAVPTPNNPFIIQRNVDNMTVDSNFTGRSNATAVTTGSGFTGRLEFWPYNYNPGAVANPTVGGSSTLYDWDDTASVGAAYYGSFQVHNVSAPTKHLVFGWSNHGSATPEIGLGNQINVVDGHPDWTFSEAASLGVINWKLQIFIGAAPNLTLAENAPAGTSAGTLTSSDPDASDTAAYTLVTGTGDTDNASFHISGSQLLSNAAFDYETKSSYTIRVRVTDAAGLSTENALLVSVTNVNEVPTALALTGSTVNENAAVNTTVGTLSGSDVDAGDTATYTLVSGAGSTDNASFNINGNALRTSALLDNEAGATRNVRVRITDTAGLFMEDTFTITVTNKNEIPSFTKGGDQRHPSSTTGALTVPGWASNMNDGDSTVTQALAFNVTNDANGMFSTQPAVNATTGNLTYTLNGTSGVATVSVSLTDDNTINGDAALTSAVQTFTITVDPAPDYVVSTTGNAILVTDMSGNGETLTVSEPSVGSIAFAAAGRTFSVDGALNTTGNSGNVSLTGVTSITVNAAGGNDTISVGGFSGITFPSLTLNGGLGDDWVAMTGDITFAANASLDADLQNDHATPGADRFTVSNNSNLLTSGTGSVTVRVSRDVAMNSGTSLETVNGGLVLEANQQATATAGSFSGISLSGATVKSSGTGLVTLKGKGGDGTAGFNTGISLNSTAQITTTGSDISLTGVGRGTAAAGTINYGITMFSGSNIYAGGTGNLTLHGTGGLGTAGASGAIFSDAGTTVSSASGNITITGIGGVTTGTNNRGVVVQTESVISAGGTGNLVVNGIGGTGTTSNHGIILLNTSNANGSRLASASGNITLNGTGGTGSYGVRVLDSGLVTTVDGALTLNGSAGTTGIHGVNLNTNSAGNGSGRVTVTGTGSAFIQASTIVLDATSEVNAGTRPVTLRGDVSGRAINLGAADVLGTVVGLTDAELDRITCGTLNIGGSTSGQITVSAAITRAAATNVNVTSSSTTGIDFTFGGTLNANGGDVNLAGGELGIMSQNSSATVLADDLVLSATGDGEIGGGSYGFRFTANTITTNSADYQTLGSMGAVTIADNDLNAGSYGTVVLALGTWSLTSTGSILSTATIDDDATLTGIGATKLVYNEGNLTPGAAGPGIITSDVLRLYDESTLNIEIGGTSPGSLATNHDQVQVSYGVSLLQGFTPLPALNVTSFGGFVPSVGQTYVIIRNDDTDPVEGHFEGLPEGTIMPNFLGSGLNALITYKGGDGNDVEIVTTVPEIGVQDYLLTELVDGSTSYTVPFGTTDVGVGLTRSFRISNTGTGDLMIGAISFQTGQSADFAVTTPPPAVIPAGGNATFAVTFTALGSGARTTVMSIASSDFDENPFDIQIGGVGSNTSGGTWTNPNTPPVIIPPNGSFVATGLNFGTQLGFAPTPNQRYTFIDIQGPPPARVIGNFNDLPEGGVVAMAFNGVIYYFQAEYSAGVDNNDLVLRNFTPAEAPAWKWVSGPSSRNGVGIYGNLGVAAPTNNPGARQGPMNWRAQDGSLWMFGGYGYATAVTNPPRYLNDLWQYDRVQGRWIWRGGNNTPNNYGVYGTQGTEAAANAPGSRHTGTTWTDGDGNLWLFGGFGVGTTPGAAALNDLWRFNMSTGRWTWMKGSTVINASAVYGTQGVAAAANTPGARSSATGFYRNGSLWLYGGYSGTNSYNDLWRYDIATGNWTWVKGSSTPNQNGVYGELGQSGTSTSPGARRDATGWVAQDGTLWMFGGLGLPDSGTALGDLSDLWKYDPATNRWTWIKGVKTTGADGMYGAKDVSHPMNLPGARSAGSGWTTVDGKFWLIGGFKNSMLTFNDVWIYDPTTNEWTWKQGADGTLSVPGVYGTQGQASASNQPGGRFTPATWVTLNGTLWIFGGGGADSFGNTGRLSDLWSFGIPNPSQTTSDNEFPAAFPDNLIVNAAPNASNATAGTTAYVPVSGKLTGTDTDGDRILFSSASATTISQGTLTLNADGTWTYTPAFGFTGIASFQFKASDDYGGQSAVKTLVITVITNPADSDGDGIADEYERSIWGNLATADADGDADRDGQSNYFEFLAQTDPLDGGERLLTAPTVSAQGTVLSLNHVRPGVNYHLETSGNLKDWSRVGTFTFQQAGSATIEPGTPPAGAPVFYRVSLEATTAIIVP